MCGLAAVEMAKDGKTGLMVTLEREDSKDYKCSTGEVALTEVAIKAKPMDDKYINSEGNFITEAFLDYVKPLIGPMPDYVQLKKD